MINQYPEKCNLCGGKVSLVSNSIIYGKSLGSGKCYLCSDCGAYVGTYVNKPSMAMGILADAEMRHYKMLCHSIFDLKWKGYTGKEKVYHRTMAYQELAKDMNIPFKDCHFGYFDLCLLKKAYLILSNNTSVVI